MDCRNVIDLLVEYLDGNVSPDTRRHLDQHLGDCSPCMAFLESYKKTSSLCRKALMREAPRELTERLTAFLRSRCKDH